LVYVNIETTAFYTPSSTKDFQKIISPLDRIFKDRQLKNSTLATQTTKSDTQNEFGI